MIMVKDILIDDYDYNLPEEKIPLHPLEKRDECKLLLCSPDRKIYHRIFKEFPDLLPPGCLMVCNDTKVIKARLPFHKSTGAAIELFLLEPVYPADYIINFQQRKSCIWKCLVGNSKKWKSGEISSDVPVTDHHTLTLKAHRIEILDEASIIEFTWDNPEFTFSQILEWSGKIPIPPYLNRESEDSDDEDYQTIYAREKGSVAAPTAGLHFTDNVFDNLYAHGVKVDKVTLHVGAGTFRPVKSKAIGDHAMHSEPFTVSKELIEDLLDWKMSDKPVVAVGTTSVRTLESLPFIGRKIMLANPDPFTINQWEAYLDADFDTGEALKAILGWMNSNGQESLSASTSIMIAPGFKWRIVDGMVTNFHQPKSTLLLLVSSFLGDEHWKKIYEEALNLDYRFLSYGDACLFIN